MVKTIVYKTQGTCSTQIEVNAEGDIITRVVFNGGCAGNTLGLSKLLAGMRIDEAIVRLEGIDCKGRGTSCPDQLSKALKQLQQK